jgi:hypothetical protein
MKRILLVVMTLALATGLILGTAGSTLAATGTQSSRGIFGTVQSVVITDNTTGVGTITLGDVKPATADNTSVEIQVTQSTTYHIPTVTFEPTQRWQTWQQLTPESQKLVREAKRVAILLTGTGGNVAARVMVIPAGYLAYRYHHHLGVVVSVSDNGTATIAEKKGGQITVTLGEGVQLAVGQFVVVVTDSNGGTELKAIKAYRIDKIVDRFEGYLEGSLTEANFDNVTALIRQTQQKHIAYLQSVQDLLQSENRTQAAAAVGRAIDYANARYSEALQFRAKIKDWIDKNGGWTAWQTHWGDTSGTITAMNTVGRTLTISTDNGTVTVHVPVAARIVKDTSTGPALFAFRSLAVGNQLEKVIYHKPTGGQFEALYIRVAE